RPLLSLYIHEVVIHSLTLLHNPAHFGPIRAKLVVTAAWFAQGDFTKTDILNILFYGYPVERLCTFQYSVARIRSRSSVSDQLAVRKLPQTCIGNSDSGAPELDTSRGHLRLTEARELKSGGKQSLLNYMGLPLYVFQKGTFFQSYLSLQQVEVLTTSAYLVTTTNQIFLHHKAEIGVDVLVNVSHSS
ncbi:transport protein Avl9-domain-containing protein, partial [Jimgerdemannia flammicorona]